VPVFAAVLLGKLITAAAVVAVQCYTDYQMKKWIERMEKLETELSDDSKEETIDFSDQENQQDDEDNPGSIAA
jgi:hypothetical protein